MIGGKLGVQTAVGRGTVGIFELPGRTFIPGLRLLSYLDKLHTRVVFVDLAILISRIIAEAT
jgi:hypothetical protein